MLALEVGCRLVAAGDVAVLVAVDARRSMACVGGERKQSQQKGEEDGRIRSTLPLHLA